MLQNSIFFFDVDGTLTTSSSTTISPTTIQSLKKLQELGHWVILTSGRDMNSLSLIHQQIALNDFSRYAITSNGACIYDFKLKKILNETTIEDTIFKKLLNELIAKKYWIKFSMDKNLYIHKKSVLTWFFGIFGKMKYRKFSEIPSLDLINKRKIGTFTTLKKNKRIKIIEKLKLDFPNLEIVTAGAGEIYIEITSKNVTKASAATFLANFNNWNLSTNTYAFGDSINDYSLFKVVPNSYAMKNGVKKLKLIATETIDSVKKDGVSKQIERLLKE